MTVTSLPPLYGKAGFCLCTVKQDSDSAASRAPVPLGVSRGCERRPVPGEHAGRLEALLFFSPAGLLPPRSSLSVSRRARLRAPAARGTGALAGPPARAPLKRGDLCPSTSLLCCASLGRGGQGRRARRWASVAPFPRRARRPPRERAHPHPRNRSALLFFC